MLALGDFLSKMSLKQVMRVFSKSFNSDESSGKYLRLKHRPGMVMCLGFVAFALLGLSCFIPMQWGSLFAACALGFPGLMMAPLLWEEWQDLNIPARGGIIQWRDGLKCGELSAERVRAVMVDYDVTPKLHKGGGRTAYVRVWAADGDKVDAGVSYPWICLFSYVPDPCAEPADQVVKQLQGKIDALGYTKDYLKLDVQPTSPPA